MKDLKILNASIPVFGSDEWRTADILIDNGIIEKIGTVNEDTEETVDAGGKETVPGFIDMHAHEDPIDAGKYEFFTSLCELRMGVTTKLAGNCGDNFDTLGDFVENIARKGSPTNYMMFVGQNKLREMAGACDCYRPSTRYELEKMKKFLAEAEQFDPVGISCGFEYAPGVTTEETIELINSFSRPGHMVSVHFRSDGADSIRSIDELIDIYKATGCGIQMSHIGSCSATGYMKGALDHLENARKNGVDITSDCYPYNAFCTGIGTAVFDGDCFEKWDKSYDALLVTKGRYKNRRCTKEIFEWLRKNEPDTNVVAFVMNDEEIDMAYKAPFVMVGSDCGFDEGCGHPRGAGAYPRLLGRYVRERGVLGLMEALKKMTIQPAERLGLKNKGDIKEGADADIVIFDKDTIIDNATFDEPSLAPSGIDRVIVGGKTAVKENTVVNGHLGRYIRYKQYR